MEAEDTKSYRTQQKQFQEGSLQQYTSTLKKEERFQTNNLILYLKELKKEQVKPKLRRSKEITKIRAEINQD